LLSGATTAQIALAGTLSFLWSNVSML